jgi:CHAD domain-containing protein
MVTSRHDEVERKYAVGEQSLMPDLSALDGVAIVAQPVTEELEAVYFDSADLDLTRHGITLRHRSGGDDAGWHLKLPRGGDTRTEVWVHSDGLDAPVPDELLASVRAVVRDRELVPVAQVTTRRRQYALRHDCGAVLALVCDDVVQGRRILEPARVQDWREWEVELVDGPAGALDVIEDLLAKTGAVRAEVGSKLARTLGEPTPASQQHGPSRKVLAGGTVGELFRARVVEQRDELQRHDAGVREGRPESVHKLRIAARRLRSALVTYQPILEHGQVDAVREDLRWLGQALSQARDARVLREHFDTLVASEPVELVIGPVARRIDDSLRTAERTGLEHGLEAMNDARYFRLLDALDDLVAAPLVTSAAGRAAREAVPRLLDRDAKRLRRAVRRIDSAVDEHGRDLALHEVRKKAKRLRYAAESAVPVLGKRATTLSGRAKEVQDTLGLHQDSVFARQWLREYGVRAHLAGDNAFSYGRLHALEQWRGDAAEAEFTASWRRLPSKRKLRRQLGWA